MKTILLAALVALLVSGCCSVPPAAVAKKEYPLPPLPLAEFFKAPVDGIYSVPKSASSPMDWASNGVIVVDQEGIRVARIAEGIISTNPRDQIWFKSVLPSDELLNQIRSGATEQDIVSRVGLPSYEGFDYYPYIHVKGSDTKYKGYSWFTVIASGEFIFMRITVNYDKAKDGGWVAGSLIWNRSGWRKLSEDNR